MENTCFDESSHKSFSDCRCGESASFSKMSGQGNDFIIIDNRQLLNVIDWPSVSMELCDRRHSIGADGLLLMGQSEQADFRLRIFNADGSEADMCGNGARCAAVWAVKKNMAGATMTMETGAGAVKAIVDGDWASIKLSAVREIKKSAMINLEGKVQVRACCIDSGVPHAIVFAGTDAGGIFFDTSLRDVPGNIIHSLGRSVRHHPNWGERGANADFVGIIDGGNIYVRTYERGVEAETKACGTGAVASAFASKLAGYVDGDSITVHMPGGILSVFFEDNGCAWLAGTVLSEFEGSVLLPITKELK